MNALVVLVSSWLDASRSKGYDYSERGYTSVHTVLYIVYIEMSASPKYIDPIKVLGGNLLALLADDVDQAE